MKRRTMILSLAFALAFALMARAVWSQQEAAREERAPVPAEKSFTGKAFTYTRALRERTRGYALYDVRFPSPVVSPQEANNTVPAELYFPTSATRARAHPAVVCLHILHGNFELERLICSRLAQSGVVALFFKQPYYGERGGELGRQILATDANLLTSALDQGLEDARRAVDVLQTMEEVHPGRIGFMGISMGAIQSASVCGREPRVYKAYLALGGGDIRKVILTAREMTGIRLFIEGLPPAEQERVWACVDRLDPLMAREALRKLAGKDRLRMVCAELDQVVPPDCSRKLAEAAGIADRVTWLKGMDHYSAMAGFPRIMDDVLAFFSADVPASWRPPQMDGEKSATELVGVFLSGLAAFLGGQPQENTAHMTGLEGEATIGGKKETFSFDYISGDRGRFKLSGVFPAIGKAGLGLGAYPWLIGGGKVVFCGTQEAVAGRLPSEMIQPLRMMRWRMALGVLAVAAQAPETLKNYYTLTESRRANGDRAVELQFDIKGAKGKLDLVFGKDDMPREASVNISGIVGRVRFTHWRLNAAIDDSVFDAPAGLPRKEVRQEDALRMFAAAFEYAMEAME
ncbi:MAG: dienelactone hydrolase family protein [Candidatus Sumerlaeota bacterium]|nr:dienelactone hydrolase family protein [Candidatus Sumerlaeota bacterium]